MADPLKRDEMIFSNPNAPANEENVGRVDLQELLLRMLAPTLRRNAGDSAFHDFQQRLLNAFARHISGDRGVVGFTANLVDFVNVDDAALCPFNVVVGRLQQLQNDVFYVFTNVSSFGQRRGIRHGEWHIENPRQGLRQQGFAAAGRTDQQNVRLREFHITILPAVAQAFVVIVYRDRKHRFACGWPMT